MKFKKMAKWFPLPVALLLRWFAAGHPQLIENVYACAIYPSISRVVGQLFGLVPFSMLEIMIVFFLFYLIFTCAKRHFARALCLLFAAFSLFFAGFSLNYFRMPLQSTLSLSVQPSDRAALIALCEKLIAVANENHCDAPDDILSLVPSAMEAAATEWPIPTGTYAAPKRALASPLMTRLLIEGIASPFTSEALVNADIPSLSLPYAACHEAAHVRGFAREEDANLIAYIACMSSDEPYFRYSAAVSALQHALVSLAGEDANAAAAIQANLSPAIRAEMAARDAFWAPYRQKKAAQLGTQMNNAYLETMGAGDQSTKSYGYVVDLLLAMERDQRIAYSQ